jgi:hypothetical protein
MQSGSCGSGDQVWAAAAATMAMMMMMMVFATWTH